MSNFGESFPALWQDSKTQAGTVISCQTLITGVSCRLSFLNAHDYSIGMLIKANGLTFTGELVTGPFYGFYYIISTRAFTVDIAFDFVGGGTATPGGNTSVNGWIGLERFTYELVDYKKPIKIVRPSVINGDVNIKKKGSYSNFDIKLNLLNMDDTNRINLSKLLNDVEEMDDLIFYPHVDGDSLKDSLGAVVYVDFSVNFKYVDSTDFRDVAQITIRSNKYTSIKQNIG